MIDITQQEVFTRVYNGLKGQDFKKSLTQWGVCAYRGEDGLKCAVGHLIPDHIYTRDMECMTVEGLSSRYGSLAWLSPHLEMLVNLQTIHDTSQMPGNGMRDWIKEYAKRSQLLIPDDEGKAI